MDWPLELSDLGGEGLVEGVVNVWSWLLVAELVVLLGLVALFWEVRRSRRFWCAIAGRDVEVEFEERGVPGLRSPCAVRSCSAFDPPTAVVCRRRCVDAAFRRQWPWPLPLRTR